MLKGIPAVLSPELLKIMMEMGHSDTIVLADGNFPGAAMARRLVRLDGHGIPEILSAMLTFFPLDTYVEKPVNLMQVMPGDTVETPIWDTYKAFVLEKAPGAEIGEVERFEFYEMAKDAYCVVQTGETALYANILLQKGVVTAEERS